MNAVDGQRGMNEVGEEQVKNRVMDSDLFIYLYEPNIGNCTARKSKKKMLILILATWNSL
jgi:histidinol phosphatase-like enzyme